MFVYQHPKLATNVEQEDMRPRAESFARILDQYRDYYRVRVGHPDWVRADKHAPCDLDLFGKISVTDAIDIGTVGDLFYGEPSFITILAEAMDKPFVVMFSSRAKTSRYIRARNLNFLRAVHKRHLGVAVYDE